MSNEKKAFSYSYSGTTNDELELIKEKYTPKHADEKMKKIRSLDKSVDFISTMISIFIGLCGTCFFVTGVIMFIKEISDFPVRFASSFLGIVLAAYVPFIHTKIYNSVKSHYAPKILELIKEIEQNQA